MTSADPALSPAEAEAATARRLAQITPRELPSRAPGMQPLVVLIGGQPGAAKSTIQGIVHASLGADSVASYDFDDDAAVHPRYDAILRAHGIEGHGIVDRSLPPDLRRRCLDHLRAGQPQYDVVVSAPLQWEDGAKQWIDDFRKAGYRVSVVYVATNEANSVLGVANRYQQAKDDTGIGRFVPIKLHDRAYRGVPDAAHALETQGYVDDIYVVNRDGQVLWENHRGPDGAMEHDPGARDAIIAERNRPPSPEERAQFLATARDLRQRDPALPALEEPVDEAVRDAMRRESLRFSPADHSPTEPRLDDRLADLQRLTTSGIAPPQSSAAPTGPQASPTSTPHAGRAADDRRPGRAQGGSRDR